MSDGISAMYDDDADGRALARRLGIQVPYTWHGMTSPMEILREYAKVKLGKDVSPWIWHEEWRTDSARGVFEDYVVERIDAIASGEESLSGEDDRWNLL